jgi:hypothetical protein
MFHRRNTARAVLCLSAVSAFYVLALLLWNPEVDSGADAQRRAMTEAAAYLRGQLDPSGRFHYLVNLDGTSAGGGYNVLRHAGTVYALALYHELSPDPATRESILRGARYLLQRHIRPVANSTSMRAVFSLPGEEVEGGIAQVKLGGCALGLIALIKARALDADVVAPEVLRELGTFILSMQEENGRFRSKYDENRGFMDGFESVYYPGEAILALALLHRADPDARWLDAALRGVRYLEASRRDTPIYRLPNDHWLMIAIAAILPQFDTAHEKLISRQRMIDHSLAIGQMMMGEQWRASWVPGMKGAFVATGSITPSSTRLEGLVALYNVLPADHPERPRVRKSIASGLGFVLRGQVREGAAKGGFNDAATSWPIPTEGARRARSRVRIDYVQHALSALVGNETIRRD